MLSRETLPKSFVAQTESKIGTIMGRFTIYPGDQVETGDPASLVVKRNGRDFHISWEIVRDVPLMTNEPEGQRPN